MKIFDIWRESFDFFLQSDEFETKVGIAKKQAEELKRLDGELANLYSDPDHKEFYREELLERRKTEREEYRRLTRFENAQFADNYKIATSFVTYLLWAKLKNEEAGDDAIRRMTTRDLIGFLEATGFAGDIVSEFKNHPVKNEFGTLRAWLVYKAGHRANSIDKSLFEAEILAHPARIVSIDYDLVPACIPLKIRAWADAITHNLLFGTCNCVEMFDEILDSNRRISGAKTRCLTGHFLNKENFQKAKNNQLPFQQRNISSPLEYVERAVLERIETDIQKSFVATMFGHAFVTPLGNKLRIGKYQGRDVVIETGRDKQTANDIQLEQQVTVLACQKCKKPVTAGTLASGESEEPRVLTLKQICCGRNCDLVYAQEIQSSLERHTLKMPFNICRHGFAWPKHLASACPACTKNTAKPKTIQFDFQVLPTQSNYDDYQWKSLILCEPNNRGVTQ